MASPKPSFCQSPPEYTPCIQSAQEGTAYLSALVMDSVLNISEREMGIVHYFLGLTMSLMYLIAGPPLTAHFLDNPGIQFTTRQGKRERHGEREKERGRKQRQGEKIGLRISIAYSWHRGMLGVLIISAETK